MNRDQASVDAQAVPTDLAIVIPAFKAQFLAAALESIAAQTDSGFSVYVGDDASPHDLHAICAPFAGRMRLHYTRFDDNLGATDLVAQWQRCIALSAEPWVWLFSDDDVMEPNCVAEWRKARNSLPAAELFHFNVLRIDAQGAVTNIEPQFPQVLSSRQFTLRRFQQQLMSYAPDYIFSRAALYRGGGFVSFPLAWCSDDATWVQIASVAHIHTIGGARVHWRYSGSNLTSFAPKTAHQKVSATVMYLQWVQNYLSAHPAKEGEPKDEDIIQAGRYWLYKQAASQRNRFFSTKGCVTTLIEVSRLRGHGFVRTIANMLLTDLQILRGS